MSSRYRRPENAGGMVLTPRDRTVLASIYRHRYLTAEHVQALHFQGLRGAQHRLRQLWTHGFLERYFFPHVVRGERQEGGTPFGRGQAPIYTIARLGAEIIAEDTGIDIDEVPYGPRANDHGSPAILHHLAVTDFFVALECACRTSPSLGLTIERELVLRRRIAAWQKLSGVGRHIISDGAFTLRAGDKAETFHLEFVRASAAGGNGALVRKLEKYVLLHRAGYFSDVLGHRNIRGVLILTTSPERAERLREMAARRLRQGRALFWFGSASARRYSGTAAAIQQDILRPIWRNVDGKPRSILFSRHP